MDFAQATQSPIIEPIGDQSVSFTPLTIRDYKPWCAELLTQRRKQSKLLIPKDANDVDKFRMARMAEFDEPSLDAIAALVWTPAGAEKVLSLSLSKNGHDETTRAAIIGALRPSRVISLAVDVSGLFEKKVPPLEEAKGQPDPNDEPAQSESAE